MERQRKERLVGAAVLVMLAVIFIPMVLDDTVQPESGISGTNIPPQPEGEFTSRVVPMESAKTPVSADPAPSEAVSVPVAVEVATPPVSGDTGTTGTATAATTAPSPATNSAPPPASTPKATDAAAAVPPAPTSTTPAGAAPASAEADVPAWVVQLGSFSDEENANALNKKLRQAGFSSFVEPLQQGGARVYRVRVGPELRRSAAQSVRDRLKSGMDLDGIVVPYP